MSEFVSICAAERLITGVGVAALVNGQQVAVFRLRDGSLHAVGNHDPFSGANVISRGLVGSLEGRKVVASPVYKQHFDLLTGACLEDAGVSIPVHAVREQDGMIQVAVTQAARAA